MSFVYIYTCTCTTLNPNPLITLLFNLSHYFLLQPIPKILIDSLLINLSLKACLQH